MKTIDEKAEEERIDKKYKKIIDIGEIGLKSLRNGLIAFGGVYLANEGFIPSDNIEDIKNNFYTSEVLSGLTTIISAYYLTIKKFFPKIYDNSVNHDCRP